MSTLDTDQKVSLTEQLAEVLSYEDQERGYPEDVAHEVLDTWLPIYCQEIVQEWMNARRPSVEDIDLLGTNHTGDVYHVMNVALYEQGLAWIYELFRDYSQEDVDNVGQALIACNTYLAVRGVSTYGPKGVRKGRTLTW
jgi:hypothetical protein